MAYKTNINGVVIECETAQEALDLARLSQNGRSAPISKQERRGPGRPPKNGSSVRENRLKQAIPIALKFLRAIETKNGGATGSDIIAALNLNSGRAIGGAVVRTLGVLRKLGFDPKRVFKVKKTPDGKVWRSGPDLGRALTTLEQEGGDESCVG